MRFRRREAGKTSAVPPIEDVPFFTNRPEPDPLPTSQHPIGNNIDQLQKAERILGITHPLSQPQPPHRNALLSLVTPNNARQRPPPSAVSAPEPAGNHLWTQPADQEYQPMDGTAPSANGGLKAWPNLQPQNLNPPIHTLRTPQDASHRNNLASKTSHSTLHSQFDAAQQNSSSGARDMGLRKIRSGVPSNKSGVESNGRPLKSALRRPSNDPEPTARPASKKEGGLRMPKFANFLPRNNSSNRSLLQPSQLSQYGSSLSVASASPSKADFRSPSFSHSDAQPSPVSGSVTSDPTMRPKVFETDVYDASKLNVRRPPKGIQNWFDGVDISSDEDDKQAGEAPQSTFSPYQDSSRQPTGQSSTRGSDRYNSSTGHAVHPDTESRRSDRQPNRPVYTQRDISDTFVEENAIAIDLARQRMKSTKNMSQSQPTSRGRRDSYAPSSFSHAQSIMSGAYDGMSDYNSMMKRDRDSRLAHSRRGDESVLSLTDNSDDDRRPRHHPRESVGADSRYTADLGEASPVSVRRPSTAPRPYMSKRSNTRDSNITTQTSGSIPIHWSNEDPIPAMPRRATGDSMVDHTSEALRRLIGRENSQRTRQSRAPSSRYESEGSATGETIDSMPSDISRMMAVTEEEMALLEMMRLKRAAMQQGNISEGAQKLLKREEEQIMIKQKAAQKVAQKLRTRESRANSRSEEWAQDLRPDYERIGGVGSRRPDQDVADKLRIERFLASDSPSPVEGAFPFPDPPSRSRQSSIPSDNAPAEGLLLPRTYTPQPGTARTHNKSVSPAPPAPSTASSADEFDADESAQLEADMRQFLGGGEFAESSAFPMPPKPSSRRSSRRVTRTNAHLAPVLPSTREEDITTPPIPTRSPNRTPYYKEESVLPPSDRTTQQTHVRADSEALHFFPPTLATRPNSRRQPEVPTSSYPTERISEFLGEANFDCGDLTFPTSAGTSASLTSTGRFDSPSIGTSQPSPLTPTFPMSQASAERGRVQIANHDAAYHHQHHAYDNADQNSMHTAKSSKSASKSQLQPQSKSQARRTSRLAQLDTLQPATYNGVSLKRTPSHVSSPGSDISASDDVLAAWAELGGVSDGLSMARARSPMRVR